MFWRHHNHPALTAFGPPVPNVFLAESVSSYLVDAFKWTFMAEQTPEWEKLYGQYHGLAKYHRELKRDLAKVGIYPSYTKVFTRAEVAEILQDFSAVTAWAFRGYANAMRLGQVPTTPRPRCSRRIR
jgi:hypothetical protein